MKRAALLLLLVATAASAQVTIVNMIPASRSGETNQDSEPTMTINPQNPMQLAASAFTFDNIAGPPMTGNLAPIWVSTDGGMTWGVVKSVPSTAGAMAPTNDITLHFSATQSGSTSLLYTGIIYIGDNTIRIYRTNDYTSNAGMTQIDKLTGNVDQPHVNVVTALHDPGVGDDRLYVAFNDFNVSKSASVDFSTNANVFGPPLFNIGRLESRMTTGWDGSGIYTAIHPDGTIYAAYYGTRAWGIPIVTDVVVDRDDTWALNAPTFQSLKQAGVQGHLVVTNVNLPGTYIGQVRTSAFNISIAVDPRDSDRVYLVWADQPAGTNNQTLHVQRSLNRGVDWSGDLATIPNGINPSLAINSHGKVALLYQQLNNFETQWQTHVIRTTDPDATVFDTPGLTLERWDSGEPQSTTPVYLGDYEYITSYGRDFYGIFSADNRPDMFNFPNSVTFHRYADFNTHKLYADAAKTIPVAYSIDPYFFHIAEVDPADDYYVRDWTLGAGNADNGAEPSTYPYFYNFSDVWNRRGPGPGMFINDQPNQEDAGNGSGSNGDNWAFARVSRRGTGTGPATVNVHFLVSKFGTGSPYVDNMTFMGTGIDLSNADVSVPFNPADAGPIVSPMYPWHLDMTSSTHLCLATEISVPGVDDIIPPSLVGKTPGWPSTDLNVINDNNKAQRNMGLTSTPSHGAKKPIGYWAIIHNIADHTRTLTIRLAAPENVAARLHDAVVEVSDRHEPVPYRIGQTIAFQNMLPGENRWLGLTIGTVDGTDGEVLPLSFDEIDGSGRAYSGFSIGLRLTSTERAVIDVLQNHRDFLWRVGAQGELRDLDGVTAANYLAFVSGHLDTLARAAAGDVQFGTAHDLQMLQAAVRSGSVEDTVAAHASLLNRLDALLTSRQLERGDAADIVPTVRWEHTLLANFSAECARSLAASTAAWLDAIDRHTGSTRDYGAMMSEQLPCLLNIARIPPDDPLATELRSSLGDPTALQHAHRALLLRMMK